jgi:hypothetical protein
MDSCILSEADTDRSFKVPWKRRRLTNVYEVDAQVFLRGNNSYISLDMKPLEE